MTTHSTPQTEKVQQMKPLASTLHVQPRRSGKTLAILLHTAQKVYSVHQQLLEKSPCKYVHLPDLETCLRTHRLLNDYKQRGYWSITLGIQLQQLSLNPKQVTTAWLYNSKLGGTRPGSVTFKNTHL